MCMSIWIGIFASNSCILLFVILYLFVLITYHYFLPFDSEHASFYPLGPVFS